MKVQELRDALQKAEADQVKKAFVECYKLLSKEKKEEADRVIESVFSGEDTQKKNVLEVIDFPVLENDINIFIENAEAQNFFAPNRFVPKSQRPKWRFMVKNFIKELQKVNIEDANNEASAKLMVKLYSLICKACNYYLFSTDDPFRSIGWTQPDLFKCIAKKVLSLGFTQENISRLIRLATSGGLSRESLYIQMEGVLLSEFTVNDVRYMAIEEAKKLITELENKLLGDCKRSFGHDYEIKEAINNCCEFILMLYIQLCEGMEGVRFLMSKYRENKEETKLYCALRTLSFMGNGELWVEAYEYGIKKKIKPRERLVEEYNEIKNKIQN